MRKNMFSSRTANAEPISIAPISMPRCLSVSTAATMHPARKIRAGMPYRTNGSSTAARLATRVASRYAPDARILVAGDREALVPVRKPGVELRRRHGLRQVEPLGRLAAHPGERLPGLLVLDPLGYDAQVQVASQLDGRPHDHRVVLVVGHLHDERLVDLQLVHGQAPQV